MDSMYRKIKTYSLVGGYYLIKSTKDKFKGK